MSGESHSVEPVAKPPAEFSRLMTEHQGRLCAFILSLVYDSELADDVLQETNLVLCRKADQYEPGTNFKAWAFRVAYLEVKTRRRKTARERLVFEESVVEQLEAEADREDGHYEVRRQRLLHCLRRLSGEQRRLVRERYLEGKPVQQIAADWSRTANSVSQALFRARRTLVECVAAGTSGHSRGTIRP